jgi:hypothetical protein
MCSSSELCSQRILKFPKCSQMHSMFPVAPGFYPLWFAQSSTPMYRNEKGEIQVYTFLIIFIFCCTNYLDGRLS